MMTIANLIRPTVVRFTLALAITAVVTPVAQAADKPDAVDRHAVTAAPVDLRSPDRKFPARVWGQPDAAERATSVGGATVIDAPQLVDYRSADTRDAVDSRYPGGSTVPASTPGGFDWGDAMYGAGATLGALLLAALALVALRQRRRIALS